MGGISTSQGRRKQSIKNSNQTFSVVFPSIHASIAFLFMQPRKILTRELYTCIGLEWNPTKISQGPNTKAPGPKSKKGENDPRSISRADFVY